MNRGTIFLDIDGTLLKHHGSLAGTILEEPVLLDGVMKKLNEWESQGFNIVLTTGRKESQRAQTEEQLQKFGIFYDHLIMGIGGGPRYLINDRHPSGKTMAYAFNIERNSGLEGVDLP